jgi:hypothetical protein
MLQESLCDPEVIPVISASDNDANIQTLNISPTNVQQIRESSIIIFRRLIEVLRCKVQYPPDSEWAEFTKGDNNDYCFFVDLMFTKLGCNIRIH